MSTATETPPVPTINIDAADIGIDDDGCLFSLKTGELFDDAILAELRAILDGAVEAPQEQRAELATLLPPYSCNCRADAEDALEKRTRIEARILALKVRLQAYTDNLNAQIRREESQLAWWDWRFKLQLIEFAKSILGKKRTALFNFGSVAFRHVAGRPSIKDEEAAVAWAKLYDPAIVKVKEWVTATDVGNALKQVRKDMEDPAFVPDCLGWKPDHESITISTGVGK